MAKRPGRLPAGVSNVTITRPVFPAEALGAPSAIPAIRLGVTVENPGDATMHVWTSRRAYDYNAATRLLTVYLTERPPLTRDAPAIQTSQSFRSAHVAIPPKGRATIDVVIPPTIRRLAPSAGPGIVIVEEPIGAIDHVELHVQSTTHPLSDAQEALALGRTERAMVTTARVSPIRLS